MSSTEAAPWGSRSRNQSWTTSERTVSYRVTTASALASYQAIGSTISSESRWLSCRSFACCVRPRSARKIRDAAPGAAVRRRAASPYGHGPISDHRPEEHSQAAEFSLPTIGLRPRHISELAGSAAFRSRLPQLAHYVACNPSTFQVRTPGGRHCVASAGQSVPCRHEEIRDLPHVGRVMPSWRGVTFWFTSSWSRPLVAGFMVESSVRAPDHAPPILSRWLTNGRTKSRADCQSNPGWCPCVQTLGHTAAA